MDDVFTELEENEKLPVISSYLERISKECLNELSEQKEGEGD